MLPRGTATLTAATIATALTLACSGDSPVTGPAEGGSQEAALNTAGGSAQTAKIFIASAFGDSLYRYEVTEGGGAVLDATIKTDPSPRGIAFDPSGEMFVANSSGWINRFLDPENAATPNGVISAANTGAPFGAPQWSDFRNGELFQAQEDGSVLRFTFDGSGNASFNGTLTAGGSTRGLRVNRTTTELFVSNLGNTIHRFVFDASGNASSNGVISGGGLSHSHGMAFTPWGELLVANLGSNSISRFTFDASGNAISNGTFSGGDMAGPLDLDFSPWGELFVTNHGQTPGKVTRWLFSSQDASATAVYNGSFSISDNLGVMRFADSGGGSANGAPLLTADTDPVSVAVGDVAHNSGTVSDPEGDAVFLTASVGTVIDNGDGTWSWSFATSGAPSSQTVTIEAEDANGAVSRLAFTLTVNNFPPAMVFIGEAFATSVFRYEVTDGGGAVLDHTITTNVSEPGGIAFGPGGEMFVSNRTGSVARYLDPEGAATPNGLITASNTGAPFGTPHWLTFRSGELFLAQQSGTVLRFTFGTSGSAAFNGTLTAGGETRGIQTNPATGEVLVSNLGNSIHRFVFDASGNASANGLITGGGMDHIHGMTFTPWGELLVANLFGHSISRFTFDASGIAISNGLISGGDMVGPIDLDFSPWGELFVTNHNQVPGKVTRWLFTSQDASASAVYNGSFEVQGNLGGIQFPEVSEGSGGAGNSAPAVASDLDPVSVFQGDVATNTGTVTDADGDPVSLTASVGTVVDNLDGTWSWSLDTSAGPVSSQTVTIDADDGNGGTAQTAFQLLVRHRPVVTADTDPVTVDEGQTANNTGAVSDADGDAVTLTASVGTVTDHGDGTWSWSLDTADGPAEGQSVTITADDGTGGTAGASFTLTVDNVAPSMDAVTVPTDPVDIGNQPVSASGTFSDPAGAADEPYACAVDYGDGSGPRVGTVSSGTTCVGPGHTYAAAGVYTVSVSVTDKDGATASLASETFLVIYDPDGGFVTGGGWIDSPPGAYATDPLLTGKASFGFVSKYQKGTTVPTGNTEFQFKAAGLNFHSSSYDWLVVTGSDYAQFKGSGTINGTGDYRFKIWAGDDAADTFRIRIWTEDAFGNETDVYDNGFDQALGGGSIKIHAK